MARPVEPLSASKTALPVVRHRFHAAHGSAFVRNVADGRWCEPQGNHGSGSVEGFSLGHEVYERRCKARPHDDQPNQILVQMACKMIVRAMNSRADTNMSKREDIEDRPQRPSK